MRHASHAEGRMDQPLGPRKKIALVAHDRKKADLIEWVKYNELLLSRHDLVATGTTGAVLDAELGVKIRRLQSGPLGGDQQLGALIADGEHPRVSTEVRAVQGLSSW